MSIFYTCVNFNRTERSAKMLNSLSNVSMISPWWFLMSQFSDELSARLANIRKYDHECVKMCPGLRDCHETPPDIWHYTGAGVASVTVSWVRACVHNQLPLSPAQPKVARQNILWEQGSLESRDLTVGVLIKLNYILFYNAGKSWTGTE